MKYNKFIAFKTGNRHCCDIHDKSGHVYPDFGYPLTPTWFGLPIDQLAKNHSGRRVHRNAINCLPPRPNEWQLAGVPHHLRYCAQCQVRDICDGETPPAGCLLPV